MPPRVCTTMRINDSQLDAMAGRASDPVAAGTIGANDEDTVYYLKICEPIIHDIAISGPFYPLSSVIPNIKGKLEGRGCGITGSLAAFEDVFVKPGPDAIRQFEHFNAQLPQGNILHIFLLKQKNATVARRLREKNDEERVRVWNVISAEPDLAMMQADRSVCQIAGFEHLPRMKAMKEMDIENAFLTKNDAETFGRRLLEDYKQELGPGTDATWNDAERGFDGFVVGGNGSSRLVAKCVMVVWDDGEIFQRPTWDSPDYRPYA